MSLSVIPGAIPLSNFPFTLNFSSPVQTAAQLKPHLSGLILFSPPLTPHYTLEKRKSCFYQFGQRNDQSLLSGSFPFSRSFIDTQTFNHN